MDDATPERWLPAPDYEGLYEVSSLGRVRSVPRMVNSGLGMLRPVPLRILKPTAPRAGDHYYTVTLCRNGRQHVLRVHVLVSRAFLGPRPENLDVCHGPAGKLDNSLPNLSYGTHAKNIGPDRWRDGTSNVGAHNGMAKLTDQIVLECRARAADGEPPGVLAAEFGVSRAAMRAVISGKSWRHLLLADEEYAAFRDAIFRREIQDSLNEARDAARHPSGVTLAEGVTLRFRPAA